MHAINNHIWDSNGKLLPIEFTESPVRDIAIVIVNRDRKDLTDYLCEQILNFSNGNNLSYDLYVVDIGSAPEGRSRFTTIEYKDVDFRGKCYAHNVGVRQAALTANYRYYWVMMNDLRFDNQPDALSRMARIMDSNPEIGIMSPTNIGVGKEYPGSSPEKGQAFRKVSVCEYLSLMMRSEVLKQVGFLNPDFKYCWGAIHELSFKIYSTGKWCLAYCDEVQFEHLGGTTYGKIKSIVSRNEYMDNAMKFAMHYLITNYGYDWDTKFAAALPKDIRERGTYSMHRNSWQPILTQDEIQIMLNKKDKMEKRNKIYSKIISKFLKL